MSKNTLAYISSTEWDWCGLYVNNKLQHQGHSIPWFMWMDTIRIFKSFKDVGWYEIDNNDLGDMGGEFPGKFSDIDQEKLLKL